MLAAIDALRAANIPLSANLKFFLEGEEEAGSPNLARTLAAHRDALASDLWIFGDGPIDPSGAPRVVLGVRGITSFDLTVYGPATSVHSGHYGNVAPNPGARLAHLIASMRGDDGRITIAGFDRAADPIAAAREMSRVAYDDAEMLARPALPRPMRSDLWRVAAAPLAQCHAAQLWRGRHARNAIDPEATAHFDVRLTPGVRRRKRCADLVTAHVRGRATTWSKPRRRATSACASALARLVWGEQGYPAAQAPLDHAGVQARHRRDARGEQWRGARAAAPGRQPADPAIGEVLDTPFVIVPIVNADNNQHAPNENLRMREFRQGVALYAALLAEGGEGW